MKRTFQPSLHFRVLTALIAAASCVRAFVCFQQNPMDFLRSDMLRHWNNGTAFPGGGYTGAGDPILYQVYVFVLHHLTGNNRLLIALASAVLSILMPWTYYRAARSFGMEKIPALWVWVLIAWTPSLLTIYHYIMMETLLLFLEGLALWMTARYLRKGGSRAFLDFVLCWSLACLTKPTIIPLVGICFLWVWWKKSTPLLDIAKGALLALILLVPQAVRTKIELGFVAPFGNPWLAQIMLRSGATETHFRFSPPLDERSSGNRNIAQFDLEFVSPSCLIRPLEPFSPWVLRRARNLTRASVSIDGAYGERDWKEAYRQFDKSRDEWLAQWRENIVLFFFAPSWPETNGEGWDRQLAYLGRWLWAPLILFVFVANIRLFLRRQFDLIPVAVTLFTLSLALQNVVLTEGRYRKPVEPVLLVNLVWVLANKRTPIPPDSAPFNGAK